MKSTILILYLVLIYFDFILSQDISADDLKLLESYEFQSLRDFVVRGKGRGFVSKVPVDRSSETAETGDILFQERHAQSPPRINTETEAPDSRETGMIPVGGQFNMNPEELAKFEIVPTSKLLQPGEFRVYPNHFITPSSTIPSTEKPQRRKHARRPISSTTAPPLSTEGPTNEDFEELAKILQQFRRSQTTPPPPPPPSTSASIPPPKPSRIPRPHLLRPQGFPTIVEQTAPEFQEFVVSSLDEKWKGMASPLKQTPSPSSSESHSLLGGINIRPSKISTTSFPPTLIPQKNDEIFSSINHSINTTTTNNNNNGDNELIAVTQEEWEEKMREISRKLGNYLMSVKKKKEQEGTLSKGTYQINGIPQHPESLPDRELTFGHGKTSSNNKALKLKQRTHPKAYVSLLREGFFHQTGTNQFTFIASITLIRDHGKVVLVDTGLATDINGRTDLIQKLTKLNIAPPNVDYVITTNGDPDHSGNTNDFPDSIHYQGNFIHFRTKFNVSKLATSSSINLTPNVQLLKTPGHSSQDISVIVSNTDKYGTIAIAGDTFISDKDIDFPMMWKKFSFNETQQEWSRREIICAANFIVPGHGKIFKITSEIKNGVSCGQPHSRSNGFPIIPSNILEGRGRRRFN